VTALCSHTGSRRSSSFSRTSAATSVTCNGTRMWCVPSPGYRSRAPRNGSAAR
jgi:hypothetical protein